MSVFIFELASSAVLAAFFGHTRISFVPILMIFFQNNYNQFHEIFDVNLLKNLIENLENFCEIICETIPKSILSEKGRSHEEGMVIGHTVFVPSMPPSK